MACARLLEPGTAQPGDAPDPRTAAAPPEADKLQCFEALLPRPPPKPVDSDALSLGRIRHRTARVRERNLAADQVCDGDDTAMTRRTTMTLVIVTSGRFNRVRTDLACARSNPDPNTSTTAMNAKTLCVAALLASTAFAANAADNASITDCVDLAGNHEIVRSGGAQSMLLRDGQSHYLIGFRGDCASLATASSIQVSSDGTANRLCPTGTKVKTNRATCSVGKVEAIDADQFSALKKRASR